jgi:beta-lactam-binding protein with PASTA domain
VTRVGNPAPRNQVVAQSPGGGSAAAKGTSVRLTVSNGGGGTGTVVVPNVVGQRANGATAAVRRAGLRPQVVYALAFNQSQVGRVLRQSPGGGSRVPRGSGVILVVGRRVF